MQNKLLSSLTALCLLGFTGQTLAQARECSVELPLGLVGSDFTPIVAYSPVNDTAQILTVSNRTFATADIIATSAGADGVFGTSDDSVSQVTNTGGSGGGKVLWSYDKGTLLFSQIDQLFRIDAGPDGLFGTSDDSAPIMISNGVVHIEKAAIKDNIVAMASSKTVAVGSAQVTTRSIEGCDLNLPAPTNGACTPGRTIRVDLPQSLNSIRVDRLVPERLAGSTFVSAGLRFNFGGIDKLTTIGLQIPSGQLIDVGSGDAQVLGSDALGNRLRLRVITSPLAQPSQQTLIESKTAQGGTLPLHSGVIEIAAIGTENDQYHTQMPYVYKTTFGGPFETYMYDIFYQHAPIQIAANASLTDLSVGGPFVAYDKQGFIMVRKCR